MSAAELAYSSAGELAAQIRARELSSVELVEAQLDRVAGIDPAIGAFVYVDGEAALAEARRADRADTPSAPFLGVPVAVKDNTDVAGMPTTCSSRAFAGRVATTDATVVAKLRAAGFVMMGKTNTPELGTLPVTESELNGACRNPWDRRLTAGGSSGGAGAAVAAGMVPVAHGTDGGGSTRIPASCCGVVGLKPSRGRISWGPRLGELAGPLATPTMIGRTVADVAATTAAIAGCVPGDPYWLGPGHGEIDGVDALERAPEPLRIAFTDSPPSGGHIDDECRRAVVAAARLLQDLGHGVEEGPVPPWNDPPAHAAVATVAGPITAYYDDLDVALLEPLNRAIVERAAATTSLEYVRALTLLHQYARRVLSFWERIDVLLTPTLALEPVPIGWIDDDIGDDPFERLRRGARFSPFAGVANVTGQPAVSLPIWWTGADIPIGVQLIGPPAGDALLLRLGAQLERAQPWGARHPEVRT